MKGSKVLQHCPTCALSCAAVSEFWDFGWSYCKIVCKSQYEKNPSLSELLWRRICCGKCCSMVTLDLKLVTGTVQDSVTLWTLSKHFHVEVNLQKSQWASTALSDPVLTAHNSLFLKFLSHVSPLLNMFHLKFSISNQSIINCVVRLSCLTNFNAYFPFCFFKTIFSPWKSLRLDTKKSVCKDLRRSVDCRVHVLDLFQGRSKYFDKVTQQV